MSTPNSRWILPPTTSLTYMTIIVLKNTVFYHIFANLICDKGGIT